MCLLPYSTTSLCLWFHLLTGQFLSGCAGGEPTSGLGLVVGLERHSDTPAFVVVGQCACEQLQIPLEKLVKFNLPSPNWTATKEVVAQHFPAGCNGCGVWVRSTVEGCSKEHVEEVMEILCRRTDIQVCQYLHKIIYQSINI